MLGGPLLSHKFFRNRYLTARVKVLTLGFGIALVNTWLLRKVAFFGIGLCLPRHPRDPSGMKKFGLRAKGNTKSKF